MLSMQLFLNFLAFELKRRLIVDSAGLGVSVIPVALFQIAGARIGGDSAARMVTTSLDTFLERDAVVRTQVVAR